MCIMYLAIKDLGRDVVAQLRELPTTQEKIRMYQEYLRTCHVEGIHLESRYDDIGLPLGQFPNEILEHYRLRTFSEYSGECAGINATLSLHKYKLA